LVISLLWAPASFCFADEPVFDRAVSRISVSGNETTRTLYILKWADLRPEEILTKKIE
jgi:hypothetical protein